MKVSRRSFVKGCAAATGALAMSGNATAQAAATDPALSPLSELAAPALAPITGEPKPATRITAAANANVFQQLPFDTDTQDYADALKGLMAPLPPEGRVIPNPYSTPDRPLPPVWNLTAYDFLKEGTEPPNATTVWRAAPPEANPSLWRQAQVNLYHGLFEVVPGIYQVRGQDLTNLTIIEGQSGVILIDPLVSCETAAAAFALYRAQRDPSRSRPVVAIIYTHTHSDHYGGVRGVVNEADVRSDKVQVIAPDNFLEKVISENVLAGTAMTRRANFSYGFYLPRGPRGQIDAGLGKATSLGTVSLIPPTDLIRKTGEMRSIDGVDIVFQLTPDAEAPAEMMAYFPQFRVLDAAEVACSLIHNVYTLRGAELRDATKWSHYLDEAIDLFGQGSDVVITSHNWPTWGGSAAVIEYLADQRDLYKYMHDQTLHLANQGLTMNEIAEELARNKRLPQALDREWYCRGYYGSVSTNVKAIYNKYLGFYDGNPSHLEPLPPEAAAKRYVEFMGGADAIVNRARRVFERASSVDDYRWIAELMSHVVFAEPTNQRARWLAADALEQLGYQAESSIWRNQYLTGAYELRNGNPNKGGSGTANADTIAAMPIGSYFDFLGVRLNAGRAEGKKTVLNWVFSGLPEGEPSQYVLTLSNSALTHRAGKQAEGPDATLTLARSALDEINKAPNPTYPGMTPEQAFDAAIASGAAQVTGDVAKVHELLGAGGLLDTFTTKFNIIEP